jgi:hypothetical protein
MPLSKRKRSIPLQPKQEEEVSFQDPSLEGGSSVWDISKTIAECDTAVNVVSDFIAQVLTPKLLDNTTTPYSPGQFLCSLECAVKEPELEYSFRPFGATSKYKAKGLAKLCKLFHGFSPQPC